MSTNAINIDDEDNSDWLHKAVTRFTISQGGKEVGTCDLKKQTIKTKDSELEEYFWLLVDEGIGKGAIGENDGSEFVAAMKLEGYKAEAVEAKNDHDQSE